MDSSPKILVYVNMPSPKQEPITNISQSVESRAFIFPNGESAS